MEDYVPPMPITVRQFEPVKGDKLFKNWVDAEGKSRTIELPPYGLPDVHKHVESFTKYMRDNYMVWARAALTPYQSIALILDREEVRDFRDNLPWCSLLNSRCHILEHN